MSTLDLLRVVVEEEEVRRPYFIEVLQRPLRPFLACRLHLPVAPAGKQTSPSSHLLIEQQGRWSTTGNC